MYISLVAGSAQAQSADALYADRENLTSARRAADIWAADLAKDPRSFEAAWKFARVCYWLGSHAPADERRGFLERGTETARLASQIEPGRPEGFFWMAANMGTLAESFGLRAGLKYRKPVKTALETVLRLDPSFMEGSADRVLGRWYYRVPGLFGGSMKQAEQHLRESLKYDQNSTISHFFLAEVLVDQNRNAEARAELQKVIDAPLSVNYAPEDREYKQKAKALLTKLQRS